MGKWIAWANRFIKKMTILDVGLLKVCLYAAGLIMGIAIPKKKKKPVVMVACLVFIATYLPVMGKVLRSLEAEKSEGISETQEG